MKYLYIPTSTLNFNSILSTESISPVAVCASRGFGNKRFEKVDPNPFENVLLLYDQYPNFKIEDTERDNYPMVLRISNERLRDELSEPANETEGILVYTRAETVYFNPSSTDFYFPAPNALKVAIAKADPSLTTKLVDLYEPHLRVKDQELDSFDWSRNNIEGISDDPKTAIAKSCESDVRINRLKGFIYGYILGAYRSINPKEMQLASEIREIRNKASAVIRDPSSSFSEKDREVLDEHLTHAKRLLEETGIGRLRFNPPNKDGIKIENSLIAEVRDSNESDKRFTNSLVSLANEYCFKSEFSRHLDEVRRQVAFDGAQAIKAYIGEHKWKDSPSKNYLTDLVNNIVSGDPFDFNSSKSLAMRSFAAFVLKGDDLEKLEDFLISNGIGDFRIAFALWGAMFGFSKIPKTVFNLPFMHGDQVYAKEMHRYVNSVIHGIPLKDLETLPLVERLPSVTLPEPQTDEPDMEVPLDELFKSLPKYKAWELKLRELLKTSNGRSKKFFEQLFSRKVTIESLGGKKSGLTKKGIKEFVLKPDKKRSFSLEPLQTISSESLQTEMFWNDVRAWDVMLNTVPIEKRTLVKERLTWFQNEWKKANSEYYGWESKEARAWVKDIPLEQRTNTQAIDAFCRHLVNNNYLYDPPLAEVKRILEDKYR